MYKSVCLGCGPRARGHAAAYAHVRKARLEAVCDLNEERLKAFADELGVPRRYTDLREMLDAERPDLLHVVTQPTQRVAFFELAAEVGLPAMLVEKPLALDAEDFNAVAALAGTLDTRVCVNHQLRYHPKTLELLNLVVAFAGDERPSRVFGQVSGYRCGIPHHPCPDRSVGELVFPSGIHGLLACGENAPVVHDPAVDWMHKRIAVYGTEGFVHWTMSSWELFTPATGYQRGEKDYGAEDILGQAAMTDAIFEWLDDDAKPHANRLDVSLAESNTVLGLYQSALDREVVELPFTPQESLLDQFKAVL